MKVKISNKKSSEYTTKKLPFQGSNLYGTFIQDSYVVYSYGEHFPIYLYKNNCWYFNTTKYSPTTQRHQQYAKPNIEFGEYKEVNLQTIKNLIYSK